MRLLIYSLIICNLCNGQAPDLTNWKSDSLPLGDRVNMANQSLNDWIFAKNGNNWAIKRSSHLTENGDDLLSISKKTKEKIKLIKGKKFYKKISSGYLMGVNNGEFGGGLYYIDSTRGKLHQIEHGLRIQNIFEYQSKLFAIEGLYHGQIIEIFKENKFWKYRSISGLIDVPKLLVDYNNEKIILSNQYLLLLNKDLKITELLKAPFYWGALYPSSILIDGEVLYIAMRQGILKIMNFVTSPKYEWFTPKQD